MRDRISPEQRAALERGVGARTAAAATAMAARAAAGAAQQCLHSAQEAQWAASGGANSYEYEYGYRYG